MAFPPYQNFMKIYQVVQNLLVGDTQKDSQIDRQTGDLISLLSFLEMRLKTTQLGLVALNGI
jgi:hypothetical protein